MSFWQFIDKLIRDPPQWPLWFGAVGAVLLVTCLVTHVMATTAKIATSLSADKSLFGMVELLIVVMLGILTFKAFYWKDISGGASHEWYEHPLAMLAILLITTLVSMFGYIKLINHPRRPDQSSG
jgi:cytochrome bd-type quinol oxidase subunit 2